MLPRLDGSKRRTETELEAAFASARPRLLGALLDAVVMALRREREISGPFPRMADFCRWVQAAELALPWAAGRFASAYAANQGGANAIALEASPVAARVMQFMAGREIWEGTASELLRAFEKGMDERALRSTGWPRNGRALSAALRRLAPNLRAVGFPVELDQPSDAGRSRRGIKLSRMEAQISVGCVAAVGASGAPDASDAGSAPRAGDLVEVDL
jgi:hypothetical protein